MIRDMAHTGAENDELGSLMSSCTAVAGCARWLKEASDKSAAVLVKLGIRMTENSASECV